MAPPPLDIVALAHQLLKHEDGASSAPAASAAAVEAACLRLKVELINLLGRGGVSALMNRALNLARRERPLLAGVTVDPDPSSSCYAGLREAFATASDEEAVASGASILAQLLSVLVLLLGEELGMQPVRKLWPQVVSSIREIENE